MGSFAVYACFILCVLLCHVADGRLRFANYYHSGMVLQQAPNKVHIWGFASANGAHVEVYVNSTVEARTTVGALQKGRWSVDMPAKFAGGPYSIHVVSSAGNTTITDVWFGDVWVCSGQSNMAFTLNHVYNHTDVVNHISKFPNIRFLRLQQKTSNTSLEEPVIATTWHAPANDYATKGYSAVCLLYAMELSPHIGNIPIGLVQTSWGGTPVEAWSSPDALGTCDADISKRDTESFDDRAATVPAHHQNSTLWNAMVVPILPMTIYGVIWYQGESNAGHAQDYNCSFSAMISDWRMKFSQNSANTTDAIFPFGFVQLAPSQNRTFHYGFSDLRWSQTSGYGYVPNAAMPRVFMAVAMDLPDFNSPYGAIHPRDKQDVAQRLAPGPFPSKYTVSPGAHTMTIEYDDGNSLIEVRTNRGFEVCCAHAENQPCRNYNAWVAANISGNHQTSVTIDTSGCHGNNAAVVAVRYAWELSPCNFKQCAVYDRNTDLPAPSFKMNAPFA